MNRISLVPVLLVAACFDPADSSDDGAQTGTTASGGSTGAVTSASTNPGTTVATSVGTGAADSSASATASDDAASVDGSGSDTTTAGGVGCHDGVFAEDAPPFGDAFLLAQLANTQGVAIADMDGDGANDVLLADYGDDVASAGVFISFGHNSGYVDDPVVLPGDPALAVRVAVAPIADATPDVVAFLVQPPSYAFVVRRWRGNGDGTFLDPDDYPDASDWDVDLFDVDGDGRRDLLGTGSTGARVSPANASEGFGGATGFGGVPASYAIRGGDVDGDGDGDVVYANNDTLAVMLSDGTGSFAGAVTYPISEQGAVDVLVADFDGDGDLDVGAAAGAIVSVRANDGAGNLGDELALTVQGSVLAAATPDFDADGCADIVVVNNSGSFSTLMARDEFTFTPQHIFTVPSGYPYDVAAGDIDGDQIPDVVGVTASSAPDAGGQVYALRSGS